MSSSSSPMASPSSSSSTLASPDLPTTTATSASSSSSSVPAMTAEEEIPSLPSPSLPPTTSSPAPAALAKAGPPSSCPGQPRRWSPDTEPRASRLARVAEDVVAALDARRRALALGEHLPLSDEVMRGSMRVLDDIIQESLATNASYNAGRWAGRGGR